MALSQTLLHCQHCGEMTLHQKTVFGVGWGLFLTFITGGFFIPFWILLAILDSSRPYSCLMCPGPASGRTHGDEAGGDREGAAAATRETQWRKPGPRPVRTPFPSEQRRTCPECRAALALNALFCRDCGARLDTPD